MRTVKEIYDELFRMYTQDRIMTPEGSKAREELYKKWIDLYEGEYVDALFAAGELSHTTYHLTHTPLGHVHHSICRELAANTLGPHKSHPGNRKHSSSV